MIRLFPAFRCMMTKPLPLLFIKREKGMEIAVHAIGDLAFEKVLDVIERYPAKPGQLDRLIHAQVLDDGLIERAARRRSDLIFSRILWPVIFRG